MTVLSEGRLSADELLFEKANAAFERQSYAATSGVIIYHDDPAGFVTDCIRWKPGEKPAFYQLANLRKLVKHLRLAVRGPHGLGKSAENAWVILWFALTRDAAGEDWKIPTTASAWRQLTHFLWPEIHKWAKRLDWEKIGRSPFTRNELLQLHLKLEHGEAFAVACEDPSTIEGAHADQILYIFDEAKAIPDATFDAAEGAFSGAGGDTANLALALASSTPGAPVGRFYDIHAHRAGFEDWHAVHVTLKDTVKAGRVSMDWAKQRAKQWGEASSVYINRVLGSFAASDEDGVIPLAWVELANERWHALAVQDNEIDPLHTVGVDVARSGADKTVLALRYGMAVRELRRYSGQSTMETAGKVLGVLAAHKHPARRIHAVVDVIGIGAGVVDRLRETSDQQIVAFNASESTDRKDMSGELGFVNKRAAALWALRDLLNPESGEDIALPEDDQLTGDLTTPTWRVTSSGKIQVESKDDFKKRLGRSPDDGDAVALAFWTEGGATRSVKNFLGNPKAGFTTGRSRPSRWTIE